MSAKKPTFKVLDTASTADRAMWVRLWQASPHREPTSHPAYAEQFADKNSRLQCLAMDSPNGKVLFPIITRPLGLEEWAQGDPRLDATTPYSYGGPYAWDATSEAADEFWDQFDNWALKERIVTLFARLSPFRKEQLLPFRGDIESPSDIVVMDLAGSDDEMLKRGKDKLRQHVKRAEREGVSIEDDPTGLRLDDFMRIYDNTMKRLDADLFYNFSAGFYNVLLEEIPEGVRFLHARHCGEVVSTQLLLLSGKHAYTLLGGTAGSGFKSYANEALIVAAARLAKAEGKETLVLGGGYGGNDSLFAYKRGFARNGVQPFEVGHRVFDREQEERLVQQRIIWERERGNDWQPRPNFFPRYRS